MGKKSLTASAQGREKAKKALISYQLKQKDLIARINCSRQPVSKFFNGQPISSELFVKICDALNLKWEEIRGNEQSTHDIDTLVSEVRQKAHTDIVKKCGTMRVLDMHQPIGLNDIYTDVHILEKITGSQRLEINQLRRDYNPDSDEFDRQWLSKREKRVSGIYIVNKSSKIVILGKPGSGKTTFLKFLCLQCISGNFQSKRLPIFISLKEFAEAQGSPSLLTFIQQKFEQLSVTKDEIVKILTYGRGLIVLDGLDEVNEEHSKKVLTEIENFSHIYSLSSLFNEDIKNHLKQREKIQTLIKRLEKKTEQPKAILRALEKDYKVFENLQNTEQSLKEDIEKLQESEKLGRRELNKTQKTLKLLRKTNEDIQLIYQNLEQQNHNNLLKKIEQQLNSLEEQLKKLKSNLEPTTKLGKSIKDSKNIYFVKFLRFVENLKQILENFQTDLEFFWSHSKYIVLKQKYEIQKQICEDLDKEIEQKRKKLEQEYPDINDLEKYQDRGLDFLCKRFPNKIYRTHFIITCRIAALDFNFTKFTEVEIADFNYQQIQTFVHKWFHLKDSIKEKKFLEQLSRNEHIRELANSPLLLTLLCLVFGAEGNFPKNRSELYENGINILLKKWDSERNIDRDEIYKNLTKERKQDLLSQVALITFDRKDYFFKQREVEKHISTYIQNLPEAKTDPEVLRLDSEAVLKSIEAQHGLLIERARGIYSFSHLTFQEYFSARKITETSNPKMLEKSLRDLASHIHEKRWREVFLLAIGLLSEADFLIQNMKEQVDLIAAQDIELQSLLEWAHQRAFYCHSSDKLSPIRIYYLTLASQLMKITYINLPSNFLNNLINIIEEQSQVELIRQSFMLDSQLSEAYYLPRNLRYNSKFAIVIAKSNNNILKFHFDDKWLDILKKPIPNPDDNQLLFDTWWKSNGKSWTQQLNQFFAQQPKTIPNFGLTSNQIELFKQYFISNEFLLECMNTNCVIDRKIRQEINDNLLLPIGEIDVLVG